MSFWHLLHLLHRKTQAWLGFLVVCTALSPGIAFAQEARSYTYDKIDFVFEIQADTSVRVKETQTYRFIGEYHQGWRNIPKKDFDDLTDVSVIEGTTGVPLTYSSKRLTKTDPASWGQYTMFYQDGEYVIEWYYDARDTTRTWVLGYTLHGALAFYDDHDELYWNLFTKYDVPIGSVDVDVFLPASEAVMGDLRETIYVDGVQGVSGSRHSESSFHFYANDLRPYAKVTIAPGWPKGIVDTGAYWRWYLRHNIFLALSIVVVVASAAAVLIRWYLTEKRPEQAAGPIIPEYAPPQSLKPAMASVILYERVVPSAWAATIIDLAVRGHIRIQEGKPTSWQRFFDRLNRWPQIIFTIFFLGFVSWALVVGMPVVLVGLFWGAPVIVLLFRMPNYFRKPRRFILELLQNPQDVLEEYEKKFLKIILTHGRWEMNPTKVEYNIPKRLQELKSELCRETEADTDMYEQGFLSDKLLNRYGITGMIAGGITFLFLVTAAHSTYFQFALFIMAVFWCGFWLTYFYRHDARLSIHGLQLKKDWLGFKLYLETAEKHRLQNLTPETFERYLPYAILFGIEKKWGKAFDGTVVNAPSWITIEGRSFSGTGTSVQSFTPSLFSTSFVSSFSSAFSRSSGSSGSGASGGGGRAGGGGGGGGGGAS